MARRVAGALGVTLAVVIAMSVRYSVSRCDSGKGLEIGVGRAAVVVRRWDPAQVQFFVDPGGWHMHHFDGAPVWWFGRSDDGTFRDTFVPLWIGVIPLLLISAVTLRRRPAGA